MVGVAAFLGVAWAVFENALFQECVVKDWERGQAPTHRMPWPRVQSSELDVGDEGGGGPPPGPFMAVAGRGWRRGLRGNTVQNVETKTSINEI